VSTTLESTLVAEIESKRAPRTPQEVIDRMIHVLNAANGLRYEIARFGDIEQQLEALRQKTESLVLRAEELGDFVRQHLFEPRVNSCVHETEELVQKVHPLERENAALRNELARLKNQTQWECLCGGTDCEGQKENAALRSLAQAMAEEMEQHGGEMAFDSLTKFRASSTTHSVAAR